MTKSLNAAICRVMERGHYILGPENQAFETAFAGYCGVAHATAVGSGTDAIELALRAIGIRQGEAVATVANAGFYVTTALLAIGATPLFVDIDPQTYLMSSSALDRLLGSTRTHCVIVTHLYGLLADMDSILAVCAARQVPVLEDCAQAHGATRNGLKAGSFGIAGCFSFYPTKNLGALGDGGAVVTGDDSVAQRISELRQYGWVGKYRVVHLGGRNSRLDEMQAAILSAKLPYLDEWNRARRQIANRYSAEITNPKIACPAALGADHVAHLYVVRSEERDDLRRHLMSRNISTGIHYPIPDHRQPCLSGMPIVAELPHTDCASAEVLTLPCFPEITDAEVDAVIDGLNTW